MALIFTSCRVTSWLKFQWSTLMSNIPNSSMLRRLVINHSTGFMGLNTIMSAMVLYCLCLLCILLQYYFFRATHALLDVKKFNQSSNHIHYKSHPKGLWNHGKQNTQSCSSLTVSECGACFGWLHWVSANSRCPRVSKTHGVCRITSTRMHTRLSTLQIWALTSFSSLLLSCWRSRSKTTIRNQLKGSESKTSLWCSWKGSWGWRLFTTWCSCLGGRLGRDCQAGPAGSHMRKASPTARSIGGQYSHSRSTSSPIIRLRMKDVTTGAGIRRAISRFSWLLHWSFCLSSTRPTQSSKRLFGVVSWSA